MSGAPSLSSGDRQTVLLVEDERLVRELLTEFLETAGYPVLAAADAESAHSLAGGASPHPPDVLISDLALPGQNGIDLFRALKRLLPQLKALFISGCASDETFTAAAAALGVPILTKPFTRDVLLHALNTLK